MHRLVGPCARPSAPGNDVHLRQIFDRRARPGQPDHCATSETAQPGQEVRLRPVVGNVAIPSLYLYTYDTPRTIPFCTVSVNVQTFFHVFAGVLGLTKPVPPPKPAKSPQNVNNNNYQQPSAGPPPYRMPPYPLYNESTPLPGSSNKIHTHSSKFPVSHRQYVMFFFVFK